MPRRTPIEKEIAMSTDRSLRYEKRMRQQGFTKVCIWVPTHCVDEYKERSQKDRDKHSKSAGSDPP